LIVSVLGCGGISIVPVRSHRVVAAFLVATFVALLTSAPASAAPRMTSARATPPKRIPVKEPARGNRALFKAITPSAMRVKAVQSVRPVSGRLVEGLRMLQPAAIDRVLAAARRQTASQALRAPDAAVQRAVTPNAGRGSSPRAPGATRRTSTLATASLGTGLKPWWAYHDYATPGVGHGTVNVGTGNVLLADDDMAVPHKGVPMVFRRTYNSQSQHDVVGTDGAQPNMYGNGWTNTFDAHLSGDTNSGTVTVFDTDGARYDYTGSDAAGWSPPPGQHATLVSDGACSYLWTKKDGTTFYFFGTVETSRCVGQYALYGGFAGRLHQIIGRNRNTYLTFNYTWDNGNAAPGGKIGAISIVAESGLTTTLTFADVSGHRLLQTLLFPDGATSVSYGYDANGNLVGVSRPPNNAGGNRPYQGFGYQALGSGTVIYWAAAPRWMASSGADGAYTAFIFAGSTQPTSTISMIGWAGTVNPTIADGSSSQVLQPAYPSTWQTYGIQYYTTGVATPTFSDTDKHALNWVLDSQQRPTQTQVATGTSTFWGTTYTNYLVSNLTWDANNNLTAFVDPGGFETDAAYDAAGNVVALGEPLTTTAQPTAYVQYRPTQLFDYDAYSNLVAYCDAAEVHPNGDWNGQYSGGSDSYCTSLLGSTNHQRMTYTATAGEPYGELTAVVAPSGYTRTVAYDASSQGGVDYGLPTRVYGTALTQLDNTGRTPSQSAAYDANGNTVCLKGDSASGAATVMSYDALGRVLAVGDPDDASMSSTACSKTAGLAGSTIVSAQTYFPDGSVASAQSPSQAARTSGTAFTYDLDGNQLQQAPYNPTPQSTLTPTLKRWFDGAERLVETSVPADPNTSGDFPLLIRYIYDLTQGGSATTISGGSLTAYGNLYEVQKNKPSGWLDFRYAAFDMADRMTVSYAFAPCPASGVAGPVYCAQTPFATQYTWDGAGGYNVNTGTFAYGLPGLLAQITNALGTTTSYAYDQDSRVTSIVYGDNVTPFTGLGYDPDGRVNYSYWAFAGGALKTSEYQYSADGELAQARDDDTSSTTSYSYYPDAVLAGVSAVTTSLVNQPSLYQYSYRNDGLLQRETFGTTSQSVSYTYTGGGRLTAMTDFGSSPSVTQSYDGHGQLASLTTPAGTYGSIAHDALGSVTSYTAFNGETVTSQYDIREDLVGRTFQPNPADPNTGYPSYPAFQYRNVQGVLVQSPSDQYDGLTGAPLVIGGYPITYDALGRMAHSGPGNTATYSYDGENRLVAGDTTAVGNAGDANCAAGGARTPSTSTETSYAYNGRGEMTQDAFSFAGHSYSRQWYWERGSPAYTASALGTGVKSLDGYQADGLGVILAGGGTPGLTISDLDLDGSFALRHNSTGHSAWYASNTYHQECVSSNPVAASSGYVDPFAANNPVPPDDGSSDPSLTVTSSGRGFLSSAMGYTTPDYSSETPYSRSTSSTRRGTSDYCAYNAETGHWEPVHVKDTPTIDACTKYPKPGSNTGGSGSIPGTGGGGYPALPRGGGGGNVNPKHPNWHSPYPRTPECDKALKEQQSRSFDVMKGLAISVPGVGLLLGAFDDANRAGNPGRRSPSPAQKASGLGLKVGVATAAIDLAYNVNKVHDVQADVDKACAGQGAGMYPYGMP
jgi:YD repeat-containing protein